MFRHKRKKQKIDKHFVSDIDKALLKFDKTHAPSASQTSEIKKYAKIFQLRDHSQPSSFTPSTVPIDL